MARTMTVDLGNELRHFVESLVQCGDYKTCSEVLRDSLRMLKEKKAGSKLEYLRQLLKEGEESGEPTEWNADDFLNQMRKKTNG